MRWKLHRFRIAPGRKVIGPPIAASEEAYAVLVIEVDSANQVSQFPKRLELDFHLEGFIDVDHGHAFALLGQPRSEQPDSVISWGAAHIRPMTVTTPLATFKQVSSHHLFRGSHESHPPLAEPYRAFTQLRNCRHVVGDENHRASATADFADLSQAFLLEPGVAHGQHF